MICCTQVVPALVKVLMTIIVIPKNHVTPYRRVDEVIVKLPSLNRPFDVVEQARSTSTKSNPRLPEPTRRQQMLQSSKPRNRTHRIESLPVPSVTAQ